MRRRRQNAWCLFTLAASLVCIEPARAQTCATNGDCDPGERCASWFDACTPGTPRTDCAEYPIDDGIDNDGDGFFDYAFGRDLPSPRAPHAVVITRGRIKPTAPSSGWMKLRLFGYGNPSIGPAFQCLVDGADLSAEDLAISMTPLASTATVPTAVDATLPAGLLELRKPDFYVFKDRLGVSGIRLAKVRRKGGALWVINLRIDGVDLTGMEHPDFTSLGALVLQFGSLGTTDTIHSWVKRGAKWRTIP